ncbi:hypothetical protein JCM8208_003421 [Rhodotorula glutinis]
MVARTTSSVRTRTGAPSNELSTTDLADCDSGLVAVVVADLDPGATRSRSGSGMYDEQEEVQEEEEAHPSTTATAGGAEQLARTLNPRARALGAGTAAPQGLSGQEEEGCQQMEQKEEVRMERKGGEAPQDEPAGHGRQGRLELSSATRCACGGPVATTSRTPSSSGDVAPHFPAPSTLPPLPSQTRFERRLLKKKCRSCPSDVLLDAASRRLHRLRRKDAQLRRQAASALPQQATDLDLKAKLSARAASAWRRPVGERRPSPSSRGYWRLVNALHRTARHPLLLCTAAAASTSSQASAEEARTQPQPEAAKAAGAMAQGSAEQREGVELTSATGASEGHCAAGEYEASSAQGGRRTSEGAGAGGAASEDPRAAEARAPRRACEYEAASLSFQGINADPITLDTIHLDSRTTTTTAEPDFKVEEERAVEKERSDLVRKELNIGLARSSYFVVASKAALGVVLAILETAQRLVKDFIGIKQVSLDVKSVDTLDTVDEVRLALAPSLPDKHLEPN